MKRVVHFFQTVRLRYLLLIWAIGLVGFLTVHFAIGQNIALGERIEEQIDRAGAAYRAKDYDQSLVLLDSAMAMIPRVETADEKISQKMQVLKKRIALRKAMAQVKNGELTDASMSLESEVAKIDQDKTLPEAVELRELYATSLYYEAWLARLEGEDRTAWEPLADAGRQQFYFLYNRSNKTNAGDKRNVEAATRLMRMDLEELKGLPLPEEVKEGKGKPSPQRGRKGKKQPGNGKKPQPRPGEDGGQGAAPILMGS